MKSNKLIIAIFTILACFMCIAYKVNVSALNQSDEIQVIGAQVRSVGNAGIRFVGSVGEYDTSDVKAYGLILAYGKTEEEIYIDSVVNDKDVFICETDSIDENGYYYVTLYDIPSTQYDINVSARAYVKDVDGNIIYGASHIARSLDEVVFKAYQDNDKSDFVCNVYNNIKEKSLECLIIENNSVTGYNGSNEIIVIPEGILAINANAFYNNTTLFYIKIPSSVIFLSASAFEGCTSLIEVTIPNKVHSIGSCAFKTCISLVNIIFEENSELASIGDYAFSGCTSLISLDIPVDAEIGNNITENCANIESISIPYLKNGYIGAIFGASSEMNNESYVPKTLKSITIKGTDAYVLMNYAFYRCKNVEYINLPEGYTIIGVNTFTSCNSLKEISIPNTVKEIQSAAFSECYSLEKIVLGENIKIIGTMNFMINPNRPVEWSLDSIYYKGTIDSWARIYFEDYTANPLNLASHLYMYDNKQEWIDISQETEIILSNKVAQINDASFSNFDKLESIIIPSSVTYIGAYAFYKCSNLKNISLPNGIYTIEESTFEHCTSLVNIDIPEGVYTIGYRALFNCISLESVVLPSSISYIDGLVFYNCENLSLINYTGSKSLWNDIQIISPNNELSETTIKYNYVRN